MSSVDDRIVNMQFNNKQFTQGVTQSQKSLDGLEQSLQKTAKSKGLEGLASSVDGVKQKFSLMQIAGVSAVATIASKATSAGIGLIKSLTIDPILQGWDEYNTNLTSIQTVMANTGKGIKPVQNALNQLNHYSDLTIYNFSEMAKNVGTFTAAGVGLKTSVAAIQGISNMAALSGSTSQQASMAMYQLSQAIAAGRVNLQDWNSVVNAGMGGKNLQRALIQTGQAMGQLNGKTVTMGRNIKIAGQSFRESISSKPGQAAWLTSDVLVKTLSLMDGRLSKTALTSKYMATQQYTLSEATAKADADLKKQQKTLSKQGFNKEQIKNLTAMAERAQQSATVVKTLPQLMGVVKESIGSVWSNAFTNIVGNFNQSKKMWTAASNSISNITKNFNNGFTTMIVNWKRQGGRLAFIDAIKTGFKDVGKILQVVGQAFRDVFPAHEGQGLANFSKMLQSLAHALTPSAKTLGSLRNIFGGLFAVFHIGFTIVKALAGALFGFLGGLVGPTNKASGGILQFAGHIGELIMKFDKFISSGNVLVHFFTMIGTAIGKVVGVLAGAGQNLFGKLIASFDTGKLSGIADTVRGVGQNVIDGLVNGLEGGATGKLKGILDAIANLIPDTIKNVLGIHSPSTVAMDIGLFVIQGLVNGLSKGIAWIFKSMGSITAAIVGGFRQLFGEMDAFDFAALINAILTGGLILTLKRVADVVKTVVDMKKVFADTFGQLQSTLKTFQHGLRVKMLLDLAVAVGLLTASLFALSLIDPQKMAVGLGGIATMIGILVGAMTALSKLEKSKASTIELAGAIFLISSAMVSLATAVIMLGKQDLKSLEKGVGALAIVMGIMTASLKALADAGKVSLGVGPAIVMMAFAMNLLAGAVALFGNMDLGTLAKGLGSVGIAMAIFTASLAVLSKVGGSGAAAAGAGILMVATAMAILVPSVLAFGKMNLGTLAKGFGAVAIALVLFTASLALLGENAAGTLAAGAAMVMMATAMAMLVPVIAAFGSMDWGTLAKGFIALGAALVLFVVSVAALGAVGEVVGPGLLMVGGALALIGLGMAAFGAGLVLMAAAGTGAIAVMTAAITAFVMLLPTIAQQMAVAFVLFLKALADAAPRVRAAMGTIFAELLGVISDALPQIGALITQLINVILKIIRDAIPKLGGIFSTLIGTGIAVIRRNVPKFVEAGFTIIDRFISSAAKHVPHIVEQAISLVTHFLNALGDNLPKLADAGMKMIIKFINGVSNAINNNVPQLRTAGLNLAGAIINGMTGGLLSSGLTAVKNAAQKIADALPGWMRKVLGIHSPSKVTAEIGRNTAEGLRVGLDSSHDRVGKSARHLGHKVAKGIATGISENIKVAVGAAVAMANAVLGAGDAEATRYYASASNAQRAADAAQARADLAKQDAAHVNRKKNPKAAKKLKKAADNAQRAADAAQAQADAAAQRASDVKDFNALDLHAKGDKRNEQAVALAQQSQKMIEKANAEAAKAAALSRTNAKRAKALRIQAQRDAAAAATLAAQSQAAHNQAVTYYAQEVTDRIDAISKARDAEKKAAADQAAYDAADTQGKIDILNARIAEQQAIADKKNADAAALLDKARAEAKSNAAQAMVDLDASEQAAQDAKDAADAAAQTKDQLSQLMGGGDSPGSVGGGSSITPSKSVLEDAANIIDRYTASLQQAQELAAAQQTVIQFNQTNTSPVALTASEIYRQTNNLLSAQEVKMGANSP